MPSRHIDDMPRDHWLAIACALVCLVPGMSLAEPQARLQRVAGFGSVAGTEQGDTFTSFDTVSINALGRIAFAGSVSGSNGTGQALSSGAADSAGVWSSFQRLSFAPNPNRTFAWAQINDESLVVAADRVSGAPASFFIRTWSAATPGANTVLLSSNDRVFSSVLLPSISNSGAVSFVGNTGSSTGLYVNTSGVRGEANGVLALTGGGFRPLQADGPTAVARIGGTPTSPVAIGRFPGEGALMTIGGLTSWGASPGITDDGRTIAFFGTDASGPGIFTYDTNVFGPGAQALRKVFSVGTPLATQYTTTFNSGVASSTATVVSQITGFSADTRVAIERLDKALDSSTTGTYMLSFVATDSSGAQGLYQARLTGFDRDASLRSGAPTLVSKIGSALLDSTTGGPVVGAIGVHDPINRNGQIAYAVQVGGAPAVALYSGVPITKYKQGNGTTASNPTAISIPGNTWSDALLHEAQPNPTWQMGKNGCFITSLSTIASFYGADVNPLEMRDLLSDTTFQKVANMATSGVNAGMLQFSTGTYFRLDSNRFLYTEQRGGSFDDIGSALKEGSALMLGVPRQKLVRSTVSAVAADDSLRKELHAIVAYGLTAAGSLKAAADITASDILVSDPGYVGYYKDLYKSLYTPDESMVDVTLQDVFNRVSDGAFTFNPRQWFDEQRFTNDGGEQVFEMLGTSDKDIAVITARTLDKSVVFDPTVAVASPVDLVLEDPSTGQRYTTRADLGGPGALLLGKTFADLASEEGDDLASFSDDPDPVDRAYSLTLPSSLRGKSLAVSIHGIGDGRYTVSLFSGDDSLTVSSALTGSITNGQIVQGGFTVTPVPEPSILLTMTAGLLVVGWSTRRSRK